MTPITARDTAVPAPAPADAPPPPDDSAGPAATYGSELPFWQRVTGAVLDSHRAAVPF